ncbi:Rz1-like lysis system protein LysC [Seminibacterium arietis]|uniref:Rz1-like lysis system protein LysC n=1 Tax=Seminibacterium arietis TaxID=1173502 RepID=A0ABW3I7S2_9PAST
MKKIKIGVISLCLVALLNCSQNNRTLYRLNCVQVPRCEPPRLTIKTNGDLVRSIQQQKQIIKLCELAQRSLQQCINDFNNTIEGKKNDN